MNFADMDPARRRKLAKRGGQARAKQFTREYQQWARSHVSSVACRRNGARGAAVTRARHGDDFLFSRWRDWKLTHPSPGEQAIAHVLDQWGVDYVRDTRFDDTLRTVDFLLLDSHVGGVAQVIEYFGEPHAVFDSAADRDQRKLADLEARGFCVLVLAPADLAHLSDRLRAFLERHDDGADDDDSLADDAGRHSRSRPSDPGEVGRGEDGWLDDAYELRTHLTDDADAEAGVCEVLA